jgi:hypothetical protein
MHSGGFVGANERPIIAEVGELILPKGAKMGGTKVQINIFPAAPGETFEQRTGKDGSVDLIGRMVEEGIKNYDRNVLPTRVSQINRDPRAR